MFFFLIHGRNMEVHHKYNVLRIPTSEWRPELQESKNYLWKNPKYNQNAAKPS